MCFLGLGPAATIALLLPATYHLNPTSGLIVLAGVVYGAMYGGSTTAILVNIPGETASMMTCIDGYPMARQGRAGAALGIAAFGSFIGGTPRVLGLMAPPMLANVRPAIRPSRILFPDGLVAFHIGVSVLGIAGQRGNHGGFRIMIGTVGKDLCTGGPRFTYGRITLMDGFGLVQIVMGLFGISEVFATWRGKRKYPNEPNPQRDTSCRTVRIGKRASARSSGGP